MGTVNARIRFDEQHGGLGFDRILGLLFERAVGY